MISHDRAQQLLSDRLDAPLALSDARALQEHLAGCGHCRAMADLFGGLATELRVLPTLPPSPAVSRAVLEHVHGRRPAWGWLRSGLGAAGSPALAVASGLALAAAVTGTIFLATNGDVDPETQRTPVSAIAATADETPTPTPPAQTVAAPTAEPLPEPTASPTATPRPRVTATPEPTRVITVRVTPTATAMPQPIEPTVAPTEVPQLAMAPEMAPEPTPEPAIRTVASEAPAEEPMAPAAAGVVEAAQAVDQDASGVSDAAIAAEPADEGQVGDQEPVVLEPAPAEEAPELAAAPVEQADAADAAAASALAPEQPEAARAASTGTPAPEAEATAPPEPAIVIAEPTPTLPIDLSIPDEPVIEQPDLLPEPSPTPTQPPIEPADGSQNAVSEQPAGGEAAPTIAPTDQQQPSEPDPQGQFVDAEQLPDAVEPPADPAAIPTEDPTLAPTAEPVVVPTEEPVVVPTEAPPAPPDGDIGAATVIGAGAPGADPVVSDYGAVLTVAPGADGVSLSAAAPDPATGAPTPIDPTDEPHADTPLGWVGGTAYYQRAYPDGRLELRAGTPGGGGYPVWSGASGGVFGPGIGPVRFTADGGRLAFLSGGALYVAPTADPNAAAPVAVGAVVGFDWSPGGDRLAVSDGYAISVFGPYGEGPLISVGNQGGIPIGTIDWRPDGIAVARYDTGEMVLIPI